MSATDRDRSLEGAPELQRFLWRLARALSRDDASAADLVQDAWVAALRSPPDDDRRLGGWLRKTLRNLAIDRGRKESRRVRHESAAAVPVGTSAGLPNRRPNPSGAKPAVATT